MRAGLLVHGDIHQPRVILKFNITNQHRDEIAMITEAKYANSQHENIVDLIEETNVTLGKNLW